MASAERTMITKTVTIPDGVVLTLTPAEAESLRLVLGRVGGSPSGRRGHMDNISDALNAVGVRWAWPNDDLLTGSVRFIGPDED